jgi:predicted phosphate transport protein (TIGR00153 family)
MPFGRLLPKEFSFFDFFEQHADKCVAAAELLSKLVGSLDQAAVIAKQIKDVEHDGDKITHNTVETLHKTFITPFDREEIHRLICGLDDVLDFIDAAGQRLALYEVKDVTPEALELCALLVKATEEMRVAIRALRTLDYPMQIIKNCVEINRLENEADAQLRAGMVRLFKEYADRPIEVIKWKEIYSFLEEATDRCEDVANTIEGVVIEHG